MRRNPYLNRSMIRSVDQFYGRQSQLERIMGRLDAFPPQSVSLVGERRTGKSSMLWHLAQQEIYSRYLSGPERFIFFYLDFQRQQHLDQEGFCRAFGQQLNEAAQGRIELGPLQGFSDLEAGIQLLERQGLRLVCLFDEFEAVTRNTHFGPEFFGLLRSLANAYPVAFVVTSGRDLQSLCHDREIAESPFFNIFAQVHIGPLRPAEGRRMIVGPSAAAGVPLADYVDRLLDLGGFLPFYLQMACSAAFECLIESGDESWEQELIEARFIEEAEGHLRYLWSHFAAAERQVLARLAGGGQPDTESEETVRGLVANGYVVRQQKECRLFSKSLVAFIQRTDPQLLDQVETEPPKGVAPLPVTSGPTIDPLPQGTNPFPRIIGQSRAMRQVLALLEKAVASEVTVLLLGDTGTGKELVARCLHDEGSRRDGPFVALNCGAVAESLLESELFGHKRGAFTDAVADRQGVFEEADGGTLFLDEIGETTPAAQVKLLRVLQEGEIRRVGENLSRQVDVRLVCATNRNLEEEISQGRFREDLYYRLYVMALSLPPLRQRRADIPLLVDHFLAEYAGGISPQALEMVRRYEWPGNIRELENQLAGAQVMAGGQSIEPQHLWPRLNQQSQLPLEEETFAEGWTLREGREHFESQFIAARLEVLDWDLDAGAKALGLSRSRLYELVRRYGIKRE